MKQLAFVATFYHFLRNTYFKNTFLRLPSIAVFLKEELKNVWSELHFEIEISLHSHDFEGSKQLIHSNPHLYPDSATSIVPKIKLRLHLTHFPIGGKL